MDTARCREGYFCNGDPLRLHKTLKTFIPLNHSQSLFRRRLREFGPKFLCWVRTEKRENPIQFFPVTRARARWPTALSSPFAASRMAERRQRRRVGDGRADGPPPSRSNDSGAGPSPSPSSSSTLQGEGGRPARARKLPQYLALSYVGMPVSKAEPLEVEGPPPPPVPPPPPLLPHLRPQRAYRGLTPLEVLHSMVALTLQHRHCRGRGEGEGRRP